MGQAEEARPISYLDQAIIRVALVEARRLIAAGKMPDEAAEPCLHGCMVAVARPSARAIVRRS